MNSKPSPADQHWYATLSQHTDFQLAEEMERAIIDDNQWRFDTLLGMSGALSENIFMYNFLRIAVEHGRVGMLKTLLHKDGSFDLASDGPQYLSIAAEHGQLAMLGYLIDELHADFRDDDNAVLVTAAQNGRLEIVNDLLRRGADPFAGGGSALTEATMGDHLTIAKRLIDAGANVDANEGASLKRAASDGRFNTVRFLLANGADPNLTDKYGSTPLSEAASQGHAEVVSLLLKKGANPRALDFLAFREAKQHRHRRVLKLLAQWERDKRAAEAANKFAEFEESFPPPYSLDDLRRKKGLSGDTGLLLAAKSGRFDELVLKATGGTPQENGGTPPHLVADDLLHPGDEAETIEPDTVLSALAARKKLQQFFNLDLWYPRKEDLMAAYDALPKIHQSQVDMMAVTAAINRRTLQKKSRNPAFKPPKL